MRKQLISFAQVIKFSKILCSRGGFTPTPPCVCPWPMLTTFCRPNSLLAFCSLQHHMHTLSHRRDYDEQKAIVVL